MWELGSLVEFHPTSFVVLADTFRGNFYDRYLNTKALSLYKNTQLGFSRRNQSFFHLLIEIFSVDALAITNI